MDETNGVAPEGELERQDVHEEEPVLARVPAAEIPELDPGHAQTLDEAREVVFHQILGKPFVARFHGRMGCKDAAAADNFAGLLKGKPLFDHERFDPFQEQECRMPLVDVVNAGLDAQLCQQPDASDPEEDLLLDARLLIGAVEAGRNGPVLGRIAGNIRVQEIQGYLADLDLPDVGEERTPGKIDGNLHFVAPIVLDDLDGHAGKIVFRIFLRLPSLLVDDLPEVAVLVQKSHSDQRDAQIASRLQVVSRQGAETSRIDGQALVKPVLGGKIGDESRPADFRGNGVFFPQALAHHVIVKALQHLGIQAQIARVFRCLLECVGGNGFEHPNGIVPQFRPQLQIQRGEEVQGPRVPCPPEIVGQLPQAGYLLGKVRDGREAAEIGLHGDHS